MADPPLRAGAVALHPPARDRAAIKARLRRAWAETDYPRALEQLQRLADESR